MLLKKSRIALAQTTAILGDVAANMRHHIALAERAHAEGADAIVFPELSLTGYTLRDLNFDVALHASSEILEPLRELSTRITIICGLVEEDERGAVYNSAFVFEDGEIIHCHRKIYPPTYGIFEEMRYFSRGDRCEAFNSRRLGRVGVLVCEDLWHPTLPYILAQDNAQLILTLAASPTRLGTGEDAAANPEIQNSIINREHHSSYARLLGVWIGFVNRAGLEDGVSFWGGSEMVAPSGEPTVRLKFFEEDFAIADVGPDAVRSARQHSRHAVDEDAALTTRMLYRVIQKRG